MCVTSATTAPIESPGVSILVDPVVSYPHPSGPPRLSHADLPEVIDYVVLTHNHQDHFLVETMLSCVSACATW